MSQLNLPLRYKETSGKQVAGRKCYSIVSCWRIAIPSNSVLYVSRYKFQYQIPRWAFQFEKHDSQGVIAGITRFMESVKFVVPLIPVRSHHITIMNMRSICLYVFGYGPLFSRLKVNVHDSLPGILRWKLLSHCRLDSFYSHFLPIQTNT